MSRAARHTPPANGRHDAPESSLVGFTPVNVHAARCPLWALINCHDVRELRSMAPWTLVMCSRSTAPPPPPLAARSSRMSRTSVPDVPDVTPAEEGHLCRTDTRDMAGARQGPWPGRALDEGSWLVHKYAIWVQYKQRASLPPSEVVSGLLTTASSSARWHHCGQIMGLNVLLNWFKAAHMSSM
eukprot:364933-Chlamydomonas_euryale.AAC.10